MLAESPLFLMLVCVVCGAVVGAFVPLLAHGLAKLRWAPFKSLAELLTTVPEPWLTLGGAGVGALLGLLVGFLAVHESLTVRISDTRIVLTVRDASREFPRGDVASAHRDGKQLVLLAPGRRGTRPREERPALAPPHRGPHRPRPRLGTGGSAPRVLAPLGPRHGGPPGGRGRPAERPRDRP